MRYLTFDTTINPNADNIFSILYAGFLAGEEGLSGLVKLRLATKILDKLEHITEKTQEGNLKLQQGHNFIALEDAEYDLLKATVSNVKWRPQFARDALRAIEFLDAAPTTDASQHQSK